MDQEKYKEMYKQAKLFDEDLNRDDIAFQLPCDFDRENLKSPCYYKPCQKDDTDPKCLRFILDYCVVFEDCGCVIHLPLLLNKLGKYEYEDIKNMETDFG